MIRLKPWDGLSYRVRPASLFERLRLAVVFVLPMFPKWGAYLPASSPPMFKKCPGKPPISPCQSFCQMIIWNFINLRPQKAWFHRRKFVSWQFQHARYDSDRPCGFVPPQIDKKVISKKIWFPFFFCLDFFITVLKWSIRKKNLHFFLKNLLILFRLWNIIYAEVFGWGTIGWNIYQQKKPLKNGDCPLGVSEFFAMKDVLKEHIKQEHPG